MWTETDTDNLDKCMRMVQKVVNKEKKSEYRRLLAKRARKFKKAIQEVKRCKKVILNFGDEWHSLIEACSPMDSGVDIETALLGETCREEIRRACEQRETRERPQTEQPHTPAPALQIDTMTEVQALLRKSRELRGK